MSKEFTRTFRVRWSEVNALGQVGLAEYLRLLMETAWDWGASQGLGLAESEALGVAWVIRETEINVVRPLNYNELFDFTVWLVNWRRVRGTRCFELRLKDGNTIVAQGTQQVATLDSQTFRPMRLPGEILEKFLFENPRIIQASQFPKFPAPPAAAYITQRVVDWRDLDALEHVNNATYASFAENAAIQTLAAWGWPPSRFKDSGLAMHNHHLQIRYQAPALWADSLTLTTYLVDVNPAGGRWHIEIKHAASAEQVVQCVLDWTLIKPGSDKRPPMPTSLYQALQERAAPDG